MALKKIVSLTIEPKQHEDLKRICRAKNLKLSAFCRKIFDEAIANEAKIVA